MILMYILQWKRMFKMYDFVTAAVSVHVGG